MLLNPALGLMQFEDIYELNYAVLNAVGLYVDAGGYVFDQDTRGPILSSGKRLKATIDPNHIVYPGNGEIMMDLLKNSKLVSFLLGYHIDKKSSMGEMGFISQFIDEIKEDPRTSLTVKLSPTESISSGWFNNKCLKYIHMILILEGDLVDLRNFDTLE